MPIPIVPWEPHVFPKKIQAELNRRRINRGLNYVKSDVKDWENDDDQWNSYRGPMTSWVRVCSNGYGIEHKENKKEDMPGFVFYGGKDFYTGYGFNKGYSKPNATIIGYTPEKPPRPHIIENDLVNSQYPINVPPPEIEKVTAIIQREYFRKVRIEWTCFSSAQLEYMTPYFLVPGITVIIEWGWNHFNLESLLDLTNKDRLAALFNNPYPLYTENIMNSRGNYEVVFGQISNFEWSIDGNKIKCVTEVVSKDRLYAGLLVDTNMIHSDEAMTNDNKSEEKAKQENQQKSDAAKVIDTLKQFVTQYIDEFKNLLDQSKSAEDLLKATTTSDLHAFFSYVQKNHPKNYKEYLFGLFFGRDEQTAIKYSGDATIKEDYANKNDDFDMKNPREHFWLNMGLVVEIINFHASQYKGVNNKELFRVDVDDCIICGHPNLISSNGDVLLIPNQLAPKYFSGIFGKEPQSGFGKFIESIDVLGIYYKPDPAEYQNKMAPCTEVMKIPLPKDLNQNEIPASLKWANYRINKICKNLGGVQRDDIGSIINFNRRFFSKENGDYEFPFAGDYFYEEGEELRTYEAFFTGFFKNLYLNAEEFKKIVKKVTKFTDIYKEIFDSINSAAGEFWQLKLAGSTGRANTGKNELATMKIVDDKLAQYTSNDVREIFTFDYNAADGLLQTINFRPMLSNMQAIRTMFAQSNLSNSKKVVMSGHNDLLDYNFRDRLIINADESSNRENPESFYKSSFQSTMEKLQALTPDPKAFQVTSKNRKGEKTIYRLAIPPTNAEVLALLLDDNDLGHNPSYCGIMPGIQAEFTLQGIAGIRTFSMFRVRGLPQPYSEENIVFRVVNVNDTLQGGQWTTTIVAGVLPLRGYFRKRLGLPVKTVAKGG